MAIVYLFVGIGLFLGAAAYYISEKYKDVAEEEGFTENKSSLFGPCDKACVYCPPKSFDDEADVALPPQLYACSVELTKGADTDYVFEPHPEENSDGSNYVVETKTLAEILAPVEPVTEAEYDSLSEILKAPHTQAPKKKKAVAKNKNTSSKTKKSNKKAGTK